MRCGAVRCGAVQSDPDTLGLQQQSAGMGNACIAESQRRESHPQHAVTLLRARSRPPQSDYMVGLASSYGGSPQLMTRLTLALLEDSGWYVARWHNAGQLGVGQGAGCDWVDKTQSEFLAAHPSSYLYCSGSAGARRAAEPAPGVRAAGRLHCGFARQAACGSGKCLQPRCSNCMWYPAARLSLGCRRTS